MPLQGDRIAYRPPVRIVALELPEPQAAKQGAIACDRVGEILNRTESEALVVAVRTGLRRRYIAFAPRAFERVIFEFNLCRRFFGLFFADG